MRKHVYTLAEIERILTYVPLLFILILMVLSLIVGNQVVDHRQKNQIAKVTQKEQRRQQHVLGRYVASITHRINLDLSEVQQALRRPVHLVEGAYRGLGPSRTLKKLIPHLKSLEKTYHIHLVIFDRNLTIFHGRHQLEAIENLIFNKSSDPKHLAITMLYILSQGKHSSLSWKNDLDKTIQESYVEHVDNTPFFFGAFSQVEGLRRHTLGTFLQSITQGTVREPGDTFWLYDSLRNRAYNYHGNHQWRPLSKPSSTLPRHTIGRLFLSVGILPKTQRIDQELQAIKQGYHDKKTTLMAVIITVGFFLLLFARMFSNIIRRILRRYSTRLKQTHARLRRLKERYELAVIASNDGLWDTNLKTHKTFFSQRWLEILGYQPGEIQTFDAWLSLMHPDDTQKTLATIAEHERTPHPDPMVCEYRLRTKSGDYKWLLGRGKVFWDHHNRPLRLMMMSTDISAQKATSEYLAQLVRKEVVKNEEKQRLLIQQNKLAAMGEMVGSIAHQWRQPLNNITLILHFVRDNIGNPDFGRDQFAHYVERAKKQIDFMSHTIDDFRDFYRPSKTQAPFDVGKAIASTVAIMQTQWDQNGIKVHMGGEGFSVHGHENEFRQAILNILSNAKDAIVARRKTETSPPGVIMIKMQKNTITLYNNGGQANLEVLERMFEPYFTTKFEDKGTGIGLYMTRTIIESNMEGHITATNRDDGVVFTITFKEERHDPYTRTVE